MDLTARVCTGLAATGLVLAVTTWQPPRHATIGDHTVPASLHCQEDEVLTVPQTPHGPAICVHVEGNILGQ